MRYTRDLSNLIILALVVFMLGCAVPQPRPNNIGETILQTRAELIALGEAFNNARKHNALDQETYDQLMESVVNGLKAAKDAEKAYDLGDMVEAEGKLGVMKAIRDELYDRQEQPQ